MIEHLAEPTSGPDEFLASTRILVDDLVGDVTGFRVGGPTDWEKVFALASNIPEEVRVEDVKVYFAVAVLMLAEERAK